MSLFKVRDFWSFDLEQLIAYCSSVARQDDLVTGDNLIHQEEDPSGSSNKESFIVDLGKFNDINNDNNNDIFVCASLKGFICLVQVTREQQNKFAAQDYQEEAENPSNQEKTEDRQLLLAQQLEFPIIDLKCVYFNSTLKQSIAVLSFNKLIIYQVRKHQVDLIAINSSSSKNQFDETFLFSHELEELNRIDLLAQELATNIVICHTDNNNSDKSLPGNKINEINESQKQSAGGGGGGGKLNLKKVKQQILQQLPQRDMIIIQYTNQFLFTLIENKKILAHYNLILDSPTLITNQQTTKNQEREDLLQLRSSNNQSIEHLTQFVGSMPMVYVHHHHHSTVNNKSSLIVSLSDNQIFSLPMEKVISQVRQNIMKKVAINLLQQQQQQQPIDKSKSINSMNDSTIELDLMLLSDWSLEMPYTPLKMLEIRRLSSNQQQSSRISQILIMSRYFLDLFSSLGEHLWSQRFEAPLICLHSYVINPFELETNQDDKMITLLCSDSVGGGKSNLLIIEEDKIVWSALLNHKPKQLMRFNLIEMKGMILALDSNSNQLSASYLGTNKGDDEDSSKVEETKLKDNNSSASAQQTNSTISLLQLELLNKPLFDEERRDDLSKLTKKSPDNLSSTGREEEEEDERMVPLDVDIQLEAFNEWPSVYVTSKISILPDSSSRKVLQDMTVSLEFDDMLKFELISTTEQQTSALIELSEGVVQIQLGSFWPDRREPKIINGRFTMSRVITQPGGNCQQQQQQIVLDDYVLPKSLQVKVFLKFNDAKSGITFVQEESFLLPLNFLAKLVHIDYSSGLLQNLEDVQANLNPYRRGRGNDSDDDYYYLCDMFARINYIDFVQLLDELIESDLICRGYNSESSNYSKQLVNYSIERKQSTLENISLLAQSLDCRLKFKSLNRSSPAGLPASSTPMLLQQSSEDHSPAIMVSIGLKIANGNNLMAKDDNSNKSFDDDADSSATYAIVWLHFCDLTATSESKIPEQMIKQHTKDWKSFDEDFGDDDRSSKVFSSQKQTTATLPVLISIECNYPMPVLFLQNHLINRLERQALAKTSHEDDLFPPLFQPLTQPICDAIEIDFKQSINNLENFISLSNNLYSWLEKLQDYHHQQLEIKFKKLKEELRTEYAKFHVSTMSLLSFSKRYFNLPDEMQKNYTDLTLLTKQYQSNLFNLLNELEKLKKLNQHFKKLPIDGKVILMEKQGGIFEYCSFNEMVSKNM